MKDVGKCSPPQLSDILGDLCSIPAKPPSVEFLKNLHPKPSSKMNLTKMTKTMACMTLIF
ncbi:hypothetical protein BC829DRAFT_282525 [Chytridium lagenaria]|nr:hypothetical protein BC829DRAFT_282525 [Chytridium lagenaria]